MRFNQIVKLSLIILIYGCNNRRDCHDRGECVNGQCQCEDQYQGNDCSQPFCIFGKVINGNCNCKFGSDLHDGYCTKSCREGIFSETTGKCICKTGWKTPGITDTINWFEGTCSQFECQSDHQCESLLPNIKNPTCPIRGWNCDCGFYHLSYINDKAGCMGFMYVLSIGTFRIYRFLCLDVIWKIVLTLIVISLPFGRIRVSCDHHRSWSVRFLKWCGYSNRCPGNCVDYRGWRFRDDLSLSIYWFKIGLWYYSFLTSLGFIFIFSWSLILWIIVMSILIVIGIMICCVTISGGGDSECSCDGCYGCYCCCNESTYSHSGNTTNYYYLGGPYPGNYGGYYYGDPCYCSGCDYHCRSDSDSDSNSRSCLLYPINYLRYIYPLFPENLHGGVVGYLMGTHPTLNKNDGNSRLVNFMSLNWTRHYDLRNNIEWRNIVRDSLNDNYQSIQSPKNVMVERNDSNISIDLNSDNEDDILDRSGVVKKIGDKRLIIYNYPVPKTVTVINREHISPDCECWICSTQPTKWMIWSCDHTFCENCSNNMIERGMVCPLCRMVSTYYRVYDS